MKEIRKNVTYQEALHALGGKGALHVQDVRSTPAIDRIARTEPGLAVYAERALLCAGNGDIVLLSRQLDREYQDYMKRIDIGTENIHVLGENNGAELIQDALLRLHKTEHLLFNALRDHVTGFTYAPFYTNHQDRAAAEALGITIFGSDDPEVTNLINSKVFCKELFECVGLPVTEGEIYDKSIHTEKDLITMIQRVIEQTGKVIIRGDIGASGSSGYEGRVEEIQQLLEHVSEDEEKIFLVESMYPITRTLNDTWMVMPDGVLYHLKSGDQILSGLSHDGNYYPAPGDVDINHDMSVRILEAMYDLGYVGVCGIDYITTTDGKEYPVEVNPRVNGSTGPWELTQKLEMRHFPINAGMTTKIPVSGDTRMSLEEVEQRLPGILYTGVENNALIPYNWGSYLDTGTMHVVIVGENLQQVHAVRDAASKKLNEKYSSSILSV